MTTRTARGTVRRAAALGAAALLLGGCLGEPGIEERWTRLDLQSSSLAPYQVLPAGSAPAVTVRLAITYRKILTGFAVAELRASSTVPAAGVTLGPDATRLPMAEDMDRILAGSVTMGRATRAITGWDHLIQTMDLTFTGTVPAGVDSSGAAPALFLVCYLGEGEEIELANGQDSLVVTPFPNTQYEILPVGLKLAVGGGTP